MQTAWKSLVLSIGFSIVAAGCVTRTINSDGSIQNTVVDSAKLSDTYVDLAVEYQQRGAPQVALDRANLAVSTDSSNARAYMVRAMIYQSLGQIKSAEKDFKKALWLNDNYSEAYVNYAVFLCDQKRYSEALENFSTALNNPLYYTPEVGYYSRGKCYYQQGELDLANQDYLKSLSYRNPPQDVYIAIAQLQYQQKHYQLANYYLNKYAGSQTPATLFLHIQILQALLDDNPTPAKVREYTGYRNTLANLLINNYGDSQEAQQYLINKSSYTSSVNSSQKNNKVISLSASSPKVEHNVILSPSANISLAEEQKLKPATTATAPSSVKVDSVGRHYIIVQPGATLYGIAREYSVSVARIAKINNISNGVVKSGHKLYLD